MAKPNNSKPDRQDKPGKTEKGRRIFEDSPRSPNTEKPTVSPRDPHTEPRDPPPKKDKGSE